MELIVRYHEASATGLSESDERELSQALGATARIDPFIRKGQAIPTASILEPITLIIVITGSLAGKAFVQEVVKDLYFFFKKRIQSQSTGGESAPVDHFAVILDIETEGKRWNIGVDFKDETTLLINFYRLRAYLEQSNSSDTHEGLVELEYPKKGGKVGVLVASAISVLTSLGALSGWYLRREVSTMLPFINSRTLSFAAGAIISLTWISFVLVPWLNWRKYRTQHEKSARNWVLELNAHGELPNNTRLNIQLGGSSTRSPGGLKEKS